jgi:hypothetical protein
MGLGRLFSAMEGRTRRADGLRRPLAVEPVAHRLTVERLPKYAPERNDIEPI